MSNQDLQRAGEGHSFAGMLNTSMAQIRAALPKHLTAERMIRTALTSYRQTPLLAKCDPKGVLASTFIAAQLGLEIGVNGEAYLLPFWSNKNRRYECQLIVGYQGYMKLARNTGQIESIETRIVYDGDEFILEYGIEQRFRHVPNLEADGDRKPLFAYCLARFKGGGYHLEVMTWREIQAIKARSPSKNKEGTIVGPWVTDEIEMARKTVVRRARKYWPQSVELATANVYDGRAARLSVEDLTGAPEVVPEVDDDAGDDGLPQQTASLPHEAGAGIQMPKARAKEPTTVTLVGDSPRIPPAPNHAAAAPDSGMPPIDWNEDGEVVDGGVSPSFALDGKPEQRVIPAEQRRTPLTPGQVKNLAAKAKAHGKTWEQVLEAIGGQEALTVENATNVHKAIEA